MAIPTPRPIRFDKHIRYLAMRNLAREVIKWKESDYIFDENVDEDESRIHDTAEELAEYFDNDSFEMACKLKDNGWDPDKQLVDILDQASHELCEMVGTVTKDWVRAYDIKPMFKVGDKVKFKYRKNGISTEGEIIKINLEEVKYSIFCKSLGHVKVGTGTTASIINFEDVELV